MILESWKMVYRRPKLVKTPKWPDQVSGPWLDKDFSTPTVNMVDELTRNGPAAQVLKSNSVQFWKQLGVSKVSIN